MKRFNESNAPRPIKSNMGNMIHYKRTQELNPNSVNTGKGRVNKKRVMQLRYLQSIGIKPVSKDILGWLESL